MRKKFNLQNNLENKKKLANKINRNLKEGIDFYYEDGFVVFTEKYLEERGYCCKSGCRHCPYRAKK